MAKPPANDCATDIYFTNIAQIFCVDPEHAVGKKRFVRRTFKSPKTARALKIPGITVDLPVKATLQGKLAAIKIAVEKRYKGGLWVPKAQTAPRKPVITPEANMLESDAGATRRSATT